jgi:SAM-dependent methyltransferase
MEFYEMTDKDFLCEEVPRPSMTFQNLIDNININQSGKRILEVGSREVTGLSGWKKAFYNAKYIGFDYYPGANVDVVGDVHNLSSYFEGEEKFDLIFSAACFEHFAMPWLASVEIAKLLKVGGHLLIATHFSYSSHERPWHFFQFSDMALKVLFSEALGFECIEQGTGLEHPIVGRFSSYEDENYRYKPVTGLYAGSVYMGKKVRDVPDFEWSKLNLRDIIGDTKYPEPESLEKTKIKNLEGKILMLNDELKAQQTAFLDQQKAQRKAIDIQEQDIEKLRTYNETEQESLRAEIKNISAEKQSLYDDFVNSASWKVTRPFRAIMQSLRGSSQK